MKRGKIFLVLDNIRSRENVGSIFRTADGVGVKKIYLCGITPVPSTGNPKSQILNPKPRTIPPRRELRGRQIQNTDKIAKTALGAEQWVSWEYRKQTWKCLLELKNQNAKIKIVGLEQTGDSQNIFKFKPRFPVVLVVGNEVRGISPKILKYCDQIVGIPMFGKKESLNVSVATGVALYQLIKPQH